MDKNGVNSGRTPLYRDVGFKFETIAQAEQAFQAEATSPQSSDEFIYTRYGNPSVVDTEKEIANIEDCEWSVLCSSGMAAVDIALSVFQKREATGKWLFFSELYGGTNIYIDEVLTRRRGIIIKRFYPERTRERFKTDKLIDAMDKLKPKVLYFEPISNPLLITVDGEDVIRIAKERKIKVVVDSTFATPLLWQPLKNGADIVVHSATKYLAGHGNLTAGVVCGNNNRLHRQAMVYRKLVGSILSPDDAYRLSTQLKTFELRFRRQCDTANKLAQLLDSLSSISIVRYPGLKRHITYSEASRLFKDKGYGALITFEIKGGRKACEIFMDKISTWIPFVPTLGNTETTIMHVPTVFGDKKYPFPGMLRLSVGLESTEVLYDCVVNALD